MADDKADDTSVEENSLSDVEQDALNSTTDVKGALTENEQPLEVEEPEDANDEAGADGKQSDKGDDDTGDVPDTDEQPDTPVDEKEEDTKPAPELEPEKDEAGVYEEKKTEDPGDFKPGDYSFEVKTTDGKTHKISTPEDADAFASKLDDDPSLISTSQFSNFQRNLFKMDAGIDADKRTYETQKADHDREQALQETKESSLKQWNSEINYLAGEEKLPAISDANNKADWSNPEAAKDPAVKARLDLLKYMNDENEKRMTAGLKPMDSLIDAFNNKRLSEMESTNKEQAKTEVQDRRTKGSKVGGNAPFSPDNPVKGTIIGTGGSLSDLVTEFMNNQ